MVCGHLNDHKHTKNHPELGPRQKVEHPAGLDEILQFSDDSRHNTLTEASSDKVKAKVLEGQTYKFVKTVTVI